MEFNHVMLVKHLYVSLDLSNHQLESANALQDLLQIVIHLLVELVHLIVMSVLHQLNVPLVNLYSPYYQVDNVNLSVELENMLITHQVHQAQQVHQVLPQTHQILPLTHHQLNLTQLTQLVVLHLMLLQMLHQTHHQTLHQIPHLILHQITQQMSHQREFYNNVLHVNHLVKIVVLLQLV
jgi:hypothetical protein